MSLLRFLVRKQSDLEASYLDKSLGKYVARPKRWLLTPLGKIALLGGAALGILYGILEIGLRAESEHRGGLER